MKFFVIAGGSFSFRARLKRRFCRRRFWDCEPSRLLKIEPNTVRVFASAYDIKGVVRRPDGSLSATGVVSNEGEPGRGPGTLMLRLISPDKLQALDHTYHRCSAEK